MLDRAIRCPFCMKLMRRQRLLARIRCCLRRSCTCNACGRPFSRAMGLQVAHLYSNIQSDFEQRLAEELKLLPVVGRAEVLVNFGMHMEDAKVASVHMLLRAMDQMLEPQFGGLARGYEGHLNITRVEKGNTACCDIDAMVEDGSLKRRRLRIARIEPSGFIQVDLNSIDRSPPARSLEHRPVG
ncbi:MAG: hypothetical protein BIFFINMI_00245 [Phycisphaerae bacterium]|nr:hypothetical protein [Phycisphaerae bacterium]